MLFSFIFYIILPIIYLSTFVPLELNFFLKSKDQRIEITKLHKFFNKNNLRNTILMFCFYKILL